MKSFSVTWSGNVITVRDHSGDMPKAGKLVWQKPFDDKFQAKPVYDKLKQYVDNEMKLLSEIDKMKKKDKPLK